MKKKIISLCLIVILALTAVGGATLAYFTDTDAKTNVFTTGKVDITLNDTFEQNSKLLPAVVDENSNILNAVDKVVSVTNNAGSEDAYVRLHIAIPSSIEPLIGLWNENAEGWNWNDGTSVEYTTKIDNIDYTVVCLTYSKKLAAEATTSDVFNWVTLDPSATNKDVEFVNNQFNIIVVAEACQAAGFEEGYGENAAFVALNTAFGTPSADKNPWAGYGA